MFDLRKIFDLRRVFAVPKDFLKSTFYCFVKSGLDSMLLFLLDDLLKFDFQIDISFKRFEHFQQIAF